MSYRVIPNGLFYKPKEIEIPKANEIRQGIRVQLSPEYMQPYSIPPELRIEETEDLQTLIQRLDQISEQDV